MLQALPSAFSRAHRERDLCKTFKPLQQFLLGIKKTSAKRSWKRAETDRRKTNPNERRWKPSPGTPNPGAPMEPPALQGQPAPPRIPNPGNTALTPQECPHPTIPFPSSTRAAPQPPPHAPVRAPHAPLSPSRAPSAPRRVLQPFRDPEGPSQSPT